MNRRRWRVRGCEQNHAAGSLGARGLDARRPQVSPAWLRPAALGLVLCLHLVFFIGVSWPPGTSTAEPPPFEIQVIASGASSAQLLVPLDSAQAVEVKPATAVAVDVQAVEAEPLRHGQEIAEFKPSEPAFATTRRKAFWCSPGQQASGTETHCSEAADGSGGSRSADARG